LEVAVGRARVRKHRPKEFPLMNRPRKELRKELLGATKGA
jgi:hypothetical protein